MATKCAGEPAVIDLTDPPPAPTIDTALNEEAVDPLSSLTALANALDCFDEDVPSFLNSIMAPHLPPPLPSSQTALPPDLGPIDRQLGELLTRLNLLSQDTSSALEQSIHDISRNVPRLTYDLQFMRESAVSLQSSLHLVQDRVARQAAGSASLSSSEKADESEEARTHRALERLAHLDKLKTRMESARDILAEAESWSTLEGEITSLIAEKKWTKAGERLAEAAKSLRVFQSAEGEYESKRSLMVSLQNELETALSAALKDAIAAVDTKECASFQDVFRMMDRGQEFQNYYFAARRVPISKAWTDAILVDAGAETRTSLDLDADNAVTFAAFLPKFYATVLSTLNAEKAQIAAIFPSESTVLVLTAFLQAALDDLSPSMPSRLAAVSEHYGAEALPELIRAFKSTEEFGVSVQSLVDTLTGHDRRASNVSGSLSPANVPASPATSTARLPRAPSLSSPLTTTPHTRHMSVSHRFSRSYSGVGEVTSSPSAWESDLYEPFLDLQTTYPAMETKYLGHLLKHDPLLNGEINEDNPSRTFTQRAVTLFSLGEDAIARCLAFTHGYGALGLVDALNELVHKFLNDNKGIIEAARSAARRGAGHDDALDLEGLDYSPQDWGAFQLGLHILEACREVRNRLSSFERKLFSALAGIGPTLNLTPADALYFHRPDTTLGAITLLQQSTLNSADLHSLITGLGGDTHSLTGAEEAVASFTRAAQVFLQSIILRPLQSHLEAYPSLSVWSQPDKAPRRGELQIPSFSLSPTDTILRVSEGLLNLLRVFEVYAADDSLAFSIETLPFVDVDSLRDLLSPPKRGGEGDALDALATPPSGSGHASPGPQQATAVTSLAAAEEGTLSPEAVLSTWVSSLALSLLSHLTRTTLPSFRTLTAPGAAQLASDLAYLSNAVRALDVEWDDLERWREAAECKDESEWRAKATDETKGPWNTMGRLRGWTSR